MLASSADWIDYVDGLTDADLDSTITYANTKGEPFRNPLWQILTHLSLHGMQHRAEAAAMLTERGASPGDIDFIRYLREAEAS
ncbi:MAG: DinB family protein [Anaerolineae bacterium]